MTNFKHTENIYNKFSDFYIEKRSKPESSFFNNYLSNYQLKKHLKNIINSKKVLDLGCGQGTFTNELYKMGANIQGIDISEQLINYARNKFPHINFVISNAQNTSFEDNYFDIIVSNLMIHYFKDLSKLFNEISRLTNNKGIFIFSFHHPFNEVIEEKNEEIIMKPYFHNKKYFWKMGNMKMISYHHTFTEISKNLKINGFYIDEIEESQAPKNSKSIDKKTYLFSNKYPTFCVIKAIKK